MFSLKRQVDRMSMKCPACAEEHSCAELEEQLFVCPSCKHYLSMPSRLRIASLVDTGSFREINRDMVSVDPLKFMDHTSYRDRLKQARQESGVREAVTTGLARMGGQRLVLAVFDFQFLGGTMGSTVGEKIARAFECATKQRIPLVSVAASGGARVQEGMLSLMQMAKVSAAAARHHREGLAFISILTDPTFGGVTASFASLGDVLIAEPGAHIGFVGPRVIQQTTGIAPPPGSHQAETLLREGMIDLVLPRQDLREVVSLLIAHLQPQHPEKGGKKPERSRHKARKLAAWEQVSLARHPGRPTARKYIARIADHFLELHGDRQRGDDPGIAGGLAELDGLTVMMIGQDPDTLENKPTNGARSMPNPEGYRKALRLMRLAAKFRIPVITLVDCPGSQTGYEAEQRGIAQALASNLAGMASLPTPTVSVIIGEGGSGGALALAVTDRVLMLEHAIYSVISPEGAAAIIYRDVQKARAVAEGLKLTARDLRKLGVIDAVVLEPAGGAHLDPASAAAAVKAAVLTSLFEIRRTPTRRLLARRYEKYRDMGRVGTFWREVVRSEVVQGLDNLTRMFPRAAAVTSYTAAERTPDRS
jgi:acyl-CoA carboxylase subunit beta